LSETKSEALSAREIEIIERVAELLKHGGNVSLSDPRVSQAQTWILGIVGAGLVGAGLWVGSAIYDLRADVSEWTTRAKTIEDHEARIRQLERRQ